MTGPRGGRGGPRRAAPVLAPALPEDRDALVALANESIPVGHRAAVREFLAESLADPDASEERCVVARDREGGALTGFALFGFVAGATGAGRIRAVAVTPLARRRGVGRGLLETAVAELRDDGARFVVAEVPDEDEMGYFTLLLEACGFSEEGRAADLVRDGVAMRYVFRRF